MNTDFGTYLRELRKSKKMTTRQLELYSGVSHSYLSQMERGLRGKPKPEILKKLHGPLDVTYEELMAKAGYIDEVEVDDMIAEAISHGYLQRDDVEQVDVVKDGTVIRELRVKYNDASKTISLIEKEAAALGMTIDDPRFQNLLLNYFKSLRIANGKD